MKQVTRKILLNPGPATTTDTVKNAMDNAQLSKFIGDLMLQEIAAGIPYEVNPETADTFGRKVLDRFANPSIEHHWINITMQYTSKMKMRNIPVITTYAQRHKSVPRKGIGKWQ